MNKQFLLIPVVLLFIELYVLAFKGLDNYSKFVFIISLLTLILVVQVYFSRDE